MRNFIRFRIAQFRDKDMPDAYYRFVERIFEQAWAEYVEAGSPFGLSEQGLTIWFEFDQIARSN